MAGHKANGLEKKKIKKQREFLKKARSLTLLASSGADNLDTTRGHGGAGGSRGTHGGRRSSARRDAGARGGEGDRGRGNSRHCVVRVLFSQCNHMTAVFLLFAKKKKKKK